MVTFQSDHSSGNGVVCILFLKYSAVCGMDWMWHKQGVDLKDRDPGRNEKVLNKDGSHGLGKQELNLRDKYRVSKNSGNREKIRLNNIFFTFSNNIWYTFPSTSRHFYRHNISKLKPNRSNLWSEERDQSINWIFPCFYRFFRYHIEPFGFGDAHWLPVGANARENLGNDSWVFGWRYWVGDNIRNPDLENKFGMFFQDLLKN